MGPVLISVGGQDLCVQFDLPDVGERSRKDTC